MGVDVASALARYTRSRALVVARFWPEWNSPECE